MLNKFQGLVHPGIFGKDPELIPIKNAFIDHWRYGHHKDFGKDTLFRDPPKEMLEYHIRHVHVNIGNYTDKFGESGTEQCWKNWASGKKDKTTNKHKKIPTSDVYVIYLVTSERHAFLLDYWDEPAHKTVEIDEQKQKLVVERDRILRLKKLESMPRDASLWDPEFYDC
ncbi:TPA: type II toxin-antitoxin system YafO family toxin [Escherichia coli]|jgi:hypothetical protein|nr:type II toxin-antitoxin system YafO family toxin [Escherichia coli]